MTKKENFEIEEGEDNFVCFLDILGFSALIGCRDRRHRSRRLKEIVQKLREQSEFDSKAHPWLSYIFISDTIIIACKQEYFLQLVWKVCQIQVNLLEIGFASRGGIDFGDVFTIPMSDDGQPRPMGLNIFGCAYINAYEMEKQSAKYPRILLSPSARTAGEAVDQRVSLLIDQDQDGWAYVNPFKRIVHYERLAKQSLHDNYNTLKKKIRELEKWAKEIEKQIGDTKERQPVAEKWRWLKFKINIEIAAICALDPAACKSQNSKSG